MNRIQLISGIISLVLAGILYLLDMTKFAYFASRPDVIIYPVWFFALLGAVLLYRAFRSYQTT
jgi:hypothetical protein